MRNRALHDALRDFAMEAAALLTEDIVAGAEVPFEIVEEPGRGTALYHYRPLTAEFLDERWGRLRELPTCPVAAHALGTGAASYLRLRGLSGREAEPALRAMLGRLWEEATAFPFPEDRFERVYAEVERTLFEHSARSTCIVPLLGMRMEAERLEMAGGLALVKMEGYGAPSEARRDDEVGNEPAVLIELQEEVASGDPVSLAGARARLLELVSGLRLFKSGALALGPLAWTRIDEGPWAPAPLGPTSTPRGEPWLLATAEHDELREFLSVVAGPAAAGTVAWARRRFDMGCERASEVDALSDYLLGLRALLDGGDDTGRASLSLRLAALCAEPADRRALQRRVELAFGLERFLIGRGGDAYADAIGFESPRALVIEVEEHLRALLRDVLCGYLDPNLKGCADDILLQSGEPIEIRAHDTRGRDRTPGAGAASAVTAPAPRVQPALSDYVTPSADWGFDDDPESYSAPV